MSQLIPYLSFNGNCKEAMEFYCECLQGELRIDLLGDSPLGANLPDELKSFVFQASLVKDELQLIATDFAPESGLKSGNAVSLYLHFQTETEIRRVYQMLSSSGEVLYPLASTHWNQLFGGLIDKYGVHWLLSSGYKNRKV